MVNAEVELVAFLLAGERFFKLREHHTQSVAIDQRMVCRGTLHQLFLSILSVHKHLVCGGYYFFVFYYHCDYLIFRPLRCPTASLND